MNFIFSQIVAQEYHALGRIGRIDAGRETLHQLVEVIVGRAHGEGVALRRVLGKQLVDDVFAAAVVDQSFQVPRIVDVLVARVDLDEAISRGDGEVGLIILVVGVGNFQLCLLGIAAEGVARLQFLEIIDGLLVVLVVELFLGLAVQLAG